MNTLINEIKNRLSEIDYFDEREFYGCSEAEICALEKVHPNHINLPGIYKEFLKFAGKGLVYMQPASSFYYRTILSFTSNEFPLFLDSSEFSNVFLVNSKPKKVFPEHGFIFYIHHGYQFEFFLCEGQEDPPVYFFSDNPELVDFKQINSRISAELISFVDEFINTHRKNITAKQPRLQKNLNVFKKKLLDIIDMVDDRKKVYLNDKNIELLYTSYRQVSRSIYALYTQPERRSQI